MAERHAGSNRYAQHARGVIGLTIRPLVRSLPPDEEWVNISYRTLDGKKEFEIRQDWLLFSPPAESEGLDSDAITSTATGIGLDLEADAIRKATKVLFAPNVVRTERKIAAQGLSYPDLKMPDIDWPDPGWPKLDWAGGKKIPLPNGTFARRGTISRGSTESYMPAVFSARAVNTKGGTFGYIRIRTFSVENANSFVAEFIRLAALLPQNGLIIDVRDNGGGLIYAGRTLASVIDPQKD